MRELSGLQNALQSRHLIGIAQGMLMKQYDITQDQSFMVLRRSASHTNVKLREIAQETVNARGLPEAYGEDSTG